LNALVFLPASPSAWPAGNYVLSFAARVLDRAERLRDGSGYVSVGLAQKINNKNVRVG